MRSRQQDTCKLNSHCSHQPGIAAAIPGLPCKPTIPPARRGCRQLLAKSPNPTLSPKPSVCAIEGRCSPNATLYDNLPEEESWQQCFDLSLLKWMSDRKIDTSTRQTYVLISVSLLLIRGYIIYLCRNRAFDNYMLLQNWGSVVKEEKRKTIASEESSIVQANFSQAILFLCLRQSLPELKSCREKASCDGSASTRWVTSISFTQAVQFHFIPTKDLFLQLTRNRWRKKK